jgi:hypothetical protein
MNALFDALNTRALLAGTRVLLFDTEDEVVERLQEAGAQFGDPQFSLAWNNRNDLDLHVIDPAGNHIWYRQRTSPTGGELDVDANADQLRTTERPVENIYWPPATRPKASTRSMCITTPITARPTLRRTPCELRLAGAHASFRGACDMASRASR